MTTSATTGVACFPIRVSIANAAPVGVCGLAEQRPPFPRATAGTAARAAAADKRNTQNHHAGDYTPVGTTELGEMARLAPQFDNRGAKVIALSCDHLANHQGWIQDIKVRFMIVPA